MKIIAILLLIISFIKLSLLKTINVSPIIEDNDKDFCTSIIVIDSIIGLICGYYILFI